MAADHLMIEGRPESGYASPPEHHIAFGVTAGPPVKGGSRCSAEFGWLLSCRPCSRLRSERPAHSITRATDPTAGAAGAAPARSVATWPADSASTTWARG